MSVSWFLTKLFRLSQRARASVPRTSLLTALCLPVAFGMLAVPAQAGKHPVPLEKGVTSQKCLECHDTKTKGKAVHSAMAKGCLSCHEVRVNGDVTRTKLTTATPLKLCLQCHGGKNAAQIKGKVHSPAVRDCLKCHDPHQSANEKQLLKPTAGAKGENLCLTCHDTGEKVAETGSRHAALDSGCGTCHLTHKTGERGDRQFDFHLTKPSPALCADCHDAKDADLVKAHKEQPISGADCLVCHDPHQSGKPKLLQRFVHAPFESGCDTCHAAPKNGKVVLTQTDSKALCATCHEQQVKTIATAKVQHPGAQGDCVSCHDPHAGKTPGFIRPNPVSACLTCHADQAEQGKKQHVHRAAFELGCATCHDAHGNDNQHLLRASTPNALCLECHGPSPLPTLAGEHTVTIFDRKVRLPEDKFANVAKLPLKYGLGHPVQFHPVVDQMQPEDASKVRVALNCLSCHQPHASAQPNLLAKDQVNGPAFCASCHKDWAQQ